MGQVNSVTEIDDDMELPCVRVNLDVHGKLYGIDRSFTLSKSDSSIKVGRASNNESRANSVRGNNCFISSPIMSRDHARFIFGDKQHPLKLVDDGSTHGTFVNTIRLRKGQEMPLENRSIVTFGSEILNGKANYLPTSYTVTFMWHEPHKSAAHHSLIDPNIIRAPSLSSISEDSLYDELDDNQVIRSPSVIMIDDPKIIDLTGDIEPAIPQDPMIGAAQPNIFNQENNIEVELVVAEQPEEVMIIKETNLYAQSRSYAFDYPESDLEEEQDTTSLSSPIQEDYDSLYDVSDTHSISKLSATADAGYDVEEEEESHQKEAEEVAAETRIAPFQINQEKIDSLTTEATETYENMAESRTAAEDTNVSSDETRLSDHYVEEDNTDSDEDPEFESSDDESADYPDSSIASEESSILHDNDDQAEDEDEYNSDAFLEQEEITTYEQALEYLGASDSMDDEFIAALVPLDGTAPFYSIETARNCVEIIADHRGSEQLWQWLETGELAKDDDENENDHDQRSTAQINIPPITEIYRPDHEDNNDEHNHQSAVLPSTNLYCPTNDFYNSMTTPFGYGPISDPSFPEPMYYPRLPNLYDTAPSYSTYYNSSNPHVPAMTYAPGLPNTYTPVVNQGSSAKMQISSILDVSPSIAPLANTEVADTIVSRQPQITDDLEEITNTKAPEMEAELPYTGRKRKFDEVSNDEPDVPQTSEETSKDILPATISESEAEHLPASLQNEASASEAVEMKRTETGEAVERGPPPSKRTRLGNALYNQRNRLRSFVSHGFAGVAGAITILAAVAITTPLQVQEELLRQSM